MKTLSTATGMMAIQRRDSYVTARRIIEQMSTQLQQTEELSRSVAPPLISSDKTSYYSRIPQTISSSLANQTTTNLITEHRLSNCGWFYPHISREHAKSLLERLPVGYFLLRTSSLSNHRYTLSVRVSDGVANVRIGHYSDDSGTTLYHLDCSRKVADRDLETSACVVRLIEQLVGLPSLSHYQFTDNRGQTISLELTKPALNEPHSLKHLCRLTINSRLNLHDTEPRANRATVSSLPLPTRLQQHLLHYPNKL